MANKPRNNPIFLVKLPTLLISHGVILLLCNVYITLCNINFTIRKRIAFSGNIENGFNYITTFIDSN